MHASDTVDTMNPLLAFIPAAIYSLASITAAILILTGTVQPF